MNCDRARELVSEALDEALGSDLETRFHRHLVDCPSCRSHFSELKESLLLLDELPRVEVGDTFDAAVWSRIRAEEAPEGAWDALRVRLADLVESWRMTSSVWKWSPVGVAAMLALFVAISPGPLPGPIETPTTSVATATDPTPSPTAVSTGRDESRSPGTSGLTGSGSHEALVAQASAADPGEIPEAIERFLQMHESRELRLDGDPDRYRRSNYSYPLRRVPDPSNSGGVGSIPVVGPHRPVTRPGPILPVAHSVSDGATVIAF